MKGNLKLLSLVRRAVHRRKKVPVELIPEGASAGTRKRLLAGKIDWATIFQLLLEIGLPALIKFLEALLKKSSRSEA